MSKLASKNFAMVFRAHLDQVHFVKPVFLQDDSYSLSLIFMERIRDDRWFIQRPAVFDTKSYSRFKDRKNRNKTIKRGKMWNNDILRICFLVPDESLLS